LGGSQLAPAARARALLRARAGPRLPAPQAATLAARTEGWAAALALAARAVAECDGPSHAVAFTGAERLLSAYVREQLLAELPATARELLLRTAALGTLSGELCDAVLARHRSGLVLRELAHGNVPLAPLDRAERRFRLHPLVAEALRAELHRRDPGWETEAHRRAGAWHARRGEPARAIDHAVLAADPARAGALLWTELPAWALGHAGARVDGWLRALGEPAVSATPALALAAALRRLARGRADEAARLADAAERALGGAPVRSDADAGVALVRAALVHESVARMRADAATARADGPGHDAWRALACLLGGVAAHLQGEDRTARRELEDGVWQARATPLLAALCRAQLVLLALDGGQPERAALIAGQAVACARAGRVERAPLCALLHAAAAVAHARTGALPQARERLDASHRVLPRATELPAWHEAQLRVARARALLRLSDAAGARAELARASRAARRLPDAARLHAWSDDAWAAADAFAASAVAGPARLTLAELRVLRLLPSHFSLREIAGRLHVSANTVRTQAHAVYRKLDVSSRSEAVARAREIGLVDAAYR
ncbi:MAG TPA: LuxR C-terminal-related transcriptional regulator, partial [Conexibacter sp.]|nr:LuxR C-terminal-related transcriptional regulator [Conexibacter sp.]